MWNWIKHKSAAGWRRVKSWWIAILVTLGIMSTAIYAETVTFTYVRAVERTDGTTLALADIAETRLYCDGVLITTEPGADQSMDAELSIGAHNCHATHVDTVGQESDPSNTVMRIVLPARPNPPVLDDPRPGPP